MPRQLAGLLTVAIVVAGCSGGSHSAVVPSTGSPTTSNATATRNVAGYATLTIVSPPGFFRARLGTKTATTGSTQRSPAYVDPGSGTYYLAIWSVNPSTQTATQAIDAPITIGSAPHQQTLSVPIYSSDPNDLVAIEYDGDPNTANNPDVLAIGETDLGNFNAGNNSGGNNGFATPGPTPSQSTPDPAGTKFPAAQITMSMYAQDYGVMQTANNSDDSAVAYPQYAGSASYGVGWSSVYFFEADATGGSATYQPGGIGGVSVPTLVSQQSGYPGAKLTGPTGGPNTAGFTASFVPSSATISATFNGTNPAGLLFNANPQPPGLYYMYYNNVPNAWLNSYPNDEFPNESLGSFVFNLSESW
jgi:hypothetical protein